MEMGTMQPRQFLDFVQTDAGKQEMIKLIREDNGIPTYLIDVLLYACNILSGSVLSAKEVDLLDKELRNANSVGMVSKSCERFANVLPISDSKIKGTKKAEIAREKINIWLEMVRSELDTMYALTAAMEGVVSLDEALSKSATSLNKVFKTKGNTIPLFDIAPDHFLRVLQVERNRFFLRKIIEEDNNVPAVLIDVLLYVSNITAGELMPLKDLDQLDKEMRNANSVGMMAKSCERFSKILSVNASQIKSTSKADIARETIKLAIKDTGHTPQNMREVLTLMKLLSKNDADFSSGVQWMVIYFSHHTVG